MKMPPFIPAALCVLGGVYLLYDGLVKNNGADVMPIALGLYFVGKGLFAYGALKSLQAIESKR